MAKQIKSKEHYQALLTAAIDWDNANLFRPDDKIAYIGVRADEITKLKLGTRFRCYYAPVQEALNSYRLVLFEVGAYFDPIRKISTRAYFELASIDFENDIWGQQIYELQNS